MSSTRKSPRRDADGRWCGVSASVLVCGSVMPAVADDEVIVDQARFRRRAQAHGNRWMSRCPQPRVNSRPKVDANDKGALSPPAMRNGVPTFDITNVKGKRGRGSCGSGAGQDEKPGVAVEEKQVDHFNSGQAQATNDPSWGSRQFDQTGPKVLGEVPRGLVRRWQSMKTPGHPPNQILHRRCSPGGTSSPIKQGGHGVRNGPWDSRCWLSLRRLRGTQLGQWSCTGRKASFRRVALDAAELVLVGYRQRNHLCSQPKCGVINLSLGGHSDDPNLKAAVDYAASNGRTVVAAVGNDGSGALTYPAPTQALSVSQPAHSQMASRRSRTTAPPLTLLLRESGFVDRSRRLREHVGNVNGSSICAGFSRPRPVGCGEPWSWRGQCRSRTFRQRRPISGRRGDLTAVLVASIHGCDVWCRCLCCWFESDVHGEEAQDHRAIESFSRPGSRVAEEDRQSLEERHREAHGR